MDVTKEDIEKAKEAWRVASFLLDTRQTELNAAESNHERACEAYHDAFFYLNEISNQYNKEQHALQQSQ